MATNSPVFIILPLYTLPKVPCPIKLKISISLPPKTYGVESNVPYVLRRVLRD